MNPEELKKGNIVGILTHRSPVAVPSGHTITITEIHLDGVTQITPTEVGERKFSFRRLHGIPLNRNTFERFDFVWNEEALWYEMEGWNPFVITEHPNIPGAFILTTFKKDWELAVFHYVHQLQNIFCSLAHRDLVLSDTPITNNR